MTTEITALSPHSLWQWFATICSIPHPSYHEEALAQHIVNWANQQQIAVERDKAGNILLRKPATKGMENRQSVVLQAHLDMVPQKNEATAHDFSRDAIQAYIDGEVVTAKETTLGADNGIGMASALAVLSDPAVEHGPIEVLLTMTEEAGMDGAFALQPNWLQSQLLINTDSEEEGEVYVGCAGGVNVNLQLPLTLQPCPTDGVLVKLTLKGLKGGHSGVDIDKGRGNANKLLARFLYHYAYPQHWQIATLSGGTLRNAIPREATVSLWIPTADLAACQQAVREFTATIQHELISKEAAISFTPTQPTDSVEQLLSIDSSRQLINLLNALPNGVIRMSDAVAGVVETSLNIGVINIKAANAEIVCLVRSLIDSGKQQVVHMLSSISQLAGADLQATGDYPGWQPDTDSSIKQLTCQTYQQLFGTIPKIMVIHAGLECGLFKKPYPNMDMVSIGPTITGAHSPDEQVYIASVERYWQLLTKLLAAIPQQ